MQIFCSCQNDKVVQVDVPVETDIIKVEMKPMEDELLNFGSINCKSKHNVSALVSGNVDRIFVKEGDFVKEGQVLCILRNLQFEIQRKQYLNGIRECETQIYIAEEQLKEEQRNVLKKIISYEMQNDSLKQKIIEYEYDKKDYEHYCEINGLGGISDRNLEERRIKLLEQETDIANLKKNLIMTNIGLRNEDITESGYEVPENKDERNRLLVEINTSRFEAYVKNEKIKLENLKNDLLSLDKMIEELTLRASVNGILYKINHSKGDHVSENEEVFSIMDTSNVYGIIFVQENEIGKYKIGSEIELEVPSVGVKSSFNISEISPAADSTSGNFCVKILMNNSRQNLKPGMFLKTKLNDKSIEKYAVIPETAILYKEDNNPFVFACCKDIAIIKKIEIKKKCNGNAYVSKGLDQNDSIVTKPSIYLKEGDKIAKKNGPTHSDFLSISELYDNNR